MPAWQRRRLAAVVTVAAAVLAAGLLLVREAGDYTIKARFVDAGGLVKGGLVEVGGATVGKITSLELTADGQAEATLRIDDGEYRPLRRGTRAAIRAVGQAGVANRFVELTPGPAEGPEIPDGGVLAPDRTRPIVDIDVLLNSLDAPTRRRLQGIVRNAAEVTAGPAAADWNLALRYLNPATAQGRALSAELTRDEAAVERLLVTGADTAAALASRRGDLEQAVEHTATTLGAIAGERAALEDVIARAPGLLRQASGTLSHTRAALREVRPALREARPVASPLARLLRRLGPAASRATPVLADLRGVVPQVRATLVRLPELARVAVPALRSTSSTLRRAQPIFAGLRPYAPDLVNGLFNSTGGTTAGFYDANGQLLRMALNVPGNTGVFAGLTDLNIPGLRGIGKGLTARCPGGAVEPAPDGSNPWIPDPSLCDPEHDQR